MEAQISSTGVRERSRNPATLEPNPLQVIGHREGATTVTSSGTTTSLLDKIGLMPIYSEGWRGWKTVAFEPADLWGRVSAEILFRDSSS